MGNWLAGLQFEKELSELEKIWNKLFLGHSMYSDISNNISNMDYMHGESIKHCKLTKGSVGDTLLYIICT